MADFSSFSNKNFDPCNWINSCLSENPNGDTMEMTISSISTKLHLISQTLTDQIETAMVDSMNTIPRLLAETHRYESQLKSLQEEMDLLSNQLNFFDKRNVTGVEDLSRLDLLKTNMESCKYTLEEHTRWNKLVRETKNLLEGGGKLSSSAERIESMFHSLSILKNLPGHQEREETCTSFKNSLLTAIRPFIQKQVLEPDVAPLYDYLYAYKKLGRESDFEEEYVQNRPKKLTDTWDEIFSEKEALLDSESFPEKIATYLGKLNSFLKEEEKSSIALFGPSKGKEIQASLLVRSLEPYKMHLKKFLAQQKSPKLLFDLYLISEEFSKLTLEQFESLENDTSSQLLGSIFEEYYTFHSVFIDSELGSLKEYLSDSINSIVFNEPTTDASKVATQSGDELFDFDMGSIDFFSFYCEHFLSSINNFFPTIQHSIDRLSKFFGGLFIKPFLKSLNAIISSYSKALIEKIHLLSIACGATQLNYSYPTIKEANHFSIVEDQKVLEANKLTAEKMAENLDLIDANDRNLLIPSLQIIQAVGRFLKKFEILEEESKKSLQSVLKVLFKTSSSSSNLTSDPGREFSIRLLEKNEPLSSDLRSFLLASSSSTFHISNNVFAYSLPMISSLKANAALLLFEISLNAPTKRLSSLFDEEVWTKDTSSQKNLEEISQNLLPSQSITHIGEHLLSLVQDLESFASSEALADLIQFKCDLASIVIQTLGWKKLAEKMKISEEKKLEEFSNRYSSANMIYNVEVSLFGSSDVIKEIYQRIDSSNSFNQISAIETPRAEFQDDMALEEDAFLTNKAAAPESSQAVETDNSLKFVNDWLIAISDAIIGLYLLQLYQINHISLVGYAQLQVDLEYVINVLNAMGIRAHPLIEHIKLIFGKDPKEINRSVEALPAKVKALNTLLQFDIKIIQAVKCS